MKFACTDYYCNENDEPVSKYEHNYNEDTSKADSDWCINSNKSVYSVDNKNNTWIKIYYENSQFCVIRVTEPPKPLQMALLIGAI